MKVLNRVKRRVVSRLHIALSRRLGLTDDSRRTVGQTVRHNRHVLAAAYIFGSGIEIGGLDRPLLVTNGARVKYVDRLSGEDLEDHYSGAGQPQVKRRGIKAPDIVSDGQTLEPIPDCSQDFVIANHVIEHFPNPLMFLKNAFRVLKLRGILFLSIQN